jgi:hypothetical protein
LRIVGGYEFYPSTANPKGLGTTQLAMAPFHGTQLTQEQQAATGARFQEAAVAVAVAVAVAARLDVEAAVAEDGSGGLLTPIRS